MKMLITLLVLTGIGTAIAAANNPKILANIGYLPGRASSHLRSSLAKLRHKKKSRHLKK